MPISRSVINLLRVITIITLLDQITNASQLQALCNWSAPHVINIYDYISYDDDLRILTRCTIGTFNYIHEALKDTLLWPRNWIQIMGHMNGYNGPLQSCVLGTKDRLLRFFMMNTTSFVHSLVTTFGQNKSIIYRDYKFISQQIVWTLGNEWLTLPTAGSATYRNLIGAGAFTENGTIAFDNAPYIADVTSIRVQRPRYGQRAYYNGHKKYHTVDFHCVHSGTGRVYSIIGSIPGSHNDITSAKHSLVYTQSAVYLSPNHVVSENLAYHNIGYPFLCRIAYQDSYTPLENAYNILHSRVRVISENFYGRYKVLWRHWESHGQ